MSVAPKLSIVLPVRQRSDGDFVDTVLDALAVQVKATNAEVVLVGETTRAESDGVRVARVQSEDLFVLRTIGVMHARGEIIAIGEDHAVPRPDWCEALLRAHAEHPGAPAVAGRLVNATDDTVCGRANFLAFSARYTEAGLREADAAQFPPPFSALSFKRDAMPDVIPVAWLETAYTPELFVEGRIAVDARIVVDHHQDHGLRWSLANAFHSARAGYGYASFGMSPSERRRQARWAVTNWPGRTADEARLGGTTGRRDLVTLSVRAIGCAVGIGAAVGSVFGPGSSPRRVA